MIVDARGRRCPLPILDLARALPRVAIGETVTVLADDPAAGPDIRAWCRLRAHEFVRAATAHDATPTYEVRRRH